MMVRGELSLVAAGSSLGVNFTIMSVAEHWATCAGSMAANTRKVSCTVEDVPALQASLPHTANTYKVSSAIEDDPAIGASLPHMCRALCDDDAEPYLGAGLLVMSVVKHKEPALRASLPHTANTYKVSSAVEDEPAIGASLPHMCRALCNDDAEPSLGAGLLVMSVVKHKEPALRASLPHTANTYKVSSAIEDEPAIGASLPHMCRDLCDDDAEPSLGAGLLVVSVVNRKVG